MGRERAACARDRPRGYLRASIDGIGDGDRGVRIEREGFSRAGVALTGGQADLLATTAYADAYGLALDDSPDVYVDASCLFAGGIADEAEGAEVPIPHQDLPWPAAATP